MPAVKKVQLILNFILTKLMYFQLHRVYLSLCSTSVGQHAMCLPIIVLLLVDYI